MERTVQVFHPIESARRSEPSTQILATIYIWTEALPIISPKLIDGSQCRALARYGVEYGGYNLQNGLGDYLLCNLEKE